jgi:hypothetical protein
LLDLRFRLIETFLVSDLLPLFPILNYQPPLIKGLLLGIGNGNVTLFLDLISFSFVFLSVLPWAFIVDWILNELLLRLGDRTLGLNEQFLFFEGHRCLK